MWKKICGAAALGGCLVVTACAVEEQGVAQKASSASDARYIVAFNNSAPGKAAVANAGGALVRDLPAHSAAAYTLPAAAAQGLSNNPHIDYVELDQPRVPLAETVPYGVTMVQADDLAFSASGPDTGDITVCIIDSGYDTHEDLPTANVTGDTAANGFADTCGHGTHVAGTIAAVGGNDTGVVGVNPRGDINLHIIKVFGNDTDACAWSYASDLIAASDACAAAGADVISMSLGCSGGPKNGPLACSSRAERQAFNTHNNNGILSIAAAGNDGNTEHSYPASYDSVMSVAAIDDAKAIATFSQQNDQVEIAAPGVAVKSTVPMGTGRGATTTVVGPGEIASSGMDGSPLGSATGSLVDCGIGDATCAGSTGAVCLIERGTITFDEKVASCAAGGGVAAIVYNNEPGIVNGTGEAMTIPAVGISQADGATLMANHLGASASVALTVEDYSAWNGTSMATPHVAGVAALIWSHDSSWTNQQIRDAMTTTAEDLGAAGRDNAFGYGLVQAADALASLQPPVCNPTSSFETDCSGAIDTDCDGLLGCADDDCSADEACSCQPTASTESDCGDGVDNDCDGFTDTDDLDCDAPNTCPLGAQGDSCDTNGDCCSDSCKGKPGRRTCK